MQDRWDTPSSNDQNSARRNKLTSKKGTLLSVDFLDDVRPNPFDAPPEQNLYGKIPPEFAFKFLQSQKTTPKRDEFSSTKYTRVKVEEADEKNNKDQAQSRPTYSSPSQHRSGPRKSEPLLDGLRSMSLSEPNSPGSSRDKRKGRYSEPFTSFAAAPQPKTEANNNSPMRNVLNVFNEPRSLNYLNLNTSVAYSDFTLKPHQAYAREWMAKQERSHGIGGLIADEMGLGKTFQAIVLIKDDKIKTQVKGLSVGPTLIVAPKSVVFQWELEIARMIKRSESLRCILYYGNQRKSKIPLSDRFLRNVDVLITTYGILASEYHEEITHRGAIFSVDFRRVILDEADIIRNASTGTAKACFAISQNAQYCWCLTGTPIQNKINDLHSLFRFIEHGVGDFSSSKWFTDNIHKPLTKGTKGCYPTQAQNLLKVRLGEIMLRRRKSDQVNGAPILTLPEMVMEIWDIELSEKERVFYDLVEQRMHQILDAVLEDDMGIEFYSTVWVMLLRLRQACLHPYLLLTQKVKDAAKDAGVEEDPKVELSDKDRAYCLDLATCLERTQASTKIDVTMQILREIRSRPGNEKTIIFSQFTSMLDLLHFFLRNENIEFVRLDGKMDMARRKDSLDALRNDHNVTVILVSLRAGGTGLNLTEANNVIMFDLWWNPAVEEQAFGRSHRMGQKKTVHIYKLVTLNTVERRILELQNQKRQLADDTLDRNEIENMKKLSRDQSLRLLNYHRRI